MSVPNQVHSKYVGGRPLPRRVSPVGMPGRFTDLWCLLFVLAMVAGLWFMHGGLKDADSGSPSGVSQSDAGPGGCTPFLIAHHVCGG